MTTPTASQTSQKPVLVVDYGAQYAQLIARRVREQQVYCEIVRHDITAARLREIAPQGIILSGGPSSVYEKGAPKCDVELFKLGIPVLGICYGMQLACDSLGGVVPFLSFIVEKKFHAEVEAELAANPQAASRY